MSVLDARSPLFIGVSKGSFPTNLNFLAYF